VLAVNVETISACRAFDEMLALPNIDLLGGVVMGRVDLTGSMKLGRDEIDCPQVFEITRDLLVKAKTKSLETAIGGGVSAHSLPFFRELPAGCLDRYETRKVIFGCPAALGDDADKGILKAVGFELLWLRNKRDYYRAISEEDQHRLAMLESRYRRLIEAAGGRVE
jgi:hypothetical protein